MPYKKGFFYLKKNTPDTLWITSTNPEEISDIIQDLKTKKANKPHSLLVRFTKKVKAITSFFALMNKLFW